MFSAVDAYDRFVGRYSRGLARQLIALSGVGPGMRALDVGCGTGALTSELVAVLGPDSLSAIDPSEAFVAAARERLPGVDIRLGPAEQLPFHDDEFYATFAQLVVNFMTDAAGGLREMSRVTRSGGRVLGAVWDYGGGMTLLRTFWDAASALSNGGQVRDERNMRYATQPELAALWQQAGLLDVAVTPVVVPAHYADFEDLWAPFEKGIGPAGAYTTALTKDRRRALKAEMQRRLGVADEPFNLTARAWAAVGRVP